jgi:hypothetical protein
MTKEIRRHKILSMTLRPLTILFCIAVFCGSLLAQTGKIITVRMLDGKTGRLIATSNFMVRIDHQRQFHADWGVQNEDGSGKLTLPAGASLLSIQATYDSSELFYVNCDSASQKVNPIEHWYSVDAILTTGVVAPNSCVRSSEAAKLAPHVKPGEFVFFVRKRNWREEFKDDYSMQ